MLDLKRLQTLGALAVAGLLAFSVAGCAPEGTPATSPMAGSDADTARNADDADQQDADSKDDESGFASNDPACLIGTWLMPNDQMQSYYDVVGTQANFEVTGDVVLEFTADKFEYRPDFTLKGDIQGMEFSGTSSGSLGGDYVTEDGVITLSNEDNNLGMVVNVNGMEIDAPGELQGIVDSMPVNSAPFECGAEGPIIHFQTGDTDERMPIQLRAK